jgi:hypothetical protein
MGDPINDAFIEMCQRKIPDRMMAMEFSVKFQRLVPQFNAKTRIEWRSFSDAKLLLTETDDYMREPGFVWVKKSGIKAWLYRALGLLLHQPALKGQGYNYKRSPYAPYPRRYAIKVQCAAFEWSRSSVERRPYSGGTWLLGQEYALAEVWFAYDPWRDTLYIDFNREWMS